MEEIKKDHKNFAFWSFILGLAGVLSWPSIMFTIFSTSFNKPSALSNWTLFLSLCFLIISQIIGLVFGSYSINSSRRKLAIAGTVLCIISLIPLILYILSYVSANS